MPARGPPSSPSMSRRDNLHTRGNHRKCLRRNHSVWLTTTAKVGIDYHVEVREDSHYYSVPHRLVGSQVELRISARCVEVFHSHQRVASHLRVFGPGHSTEISHMPIAHRRHAEWTPERLVQWAARTGEATAALVAGIMERRPHPEHARRRCDRWGHRPLLRDHLHRGGHRRGQRVGLRPGRLPGQLGYGLPRRVQSLRDNDPLGGSWIGSPAALSKFRP